MCVCVCVRGKKKIVHFSQGPRYVTGIVNGKTVRLGAAKRDWDATCHRTLYISFEPS